MKFHTTLLSLVLVSVACGPKADTAAPEPAPAPAPAPVAKPAAKPIPEGFFVLTPQITVKGIDAAIEFYGKAFGAQKLFTMNGPDGKTAHAEIKIGDSIIMVDEENADMKGPLTLGGSPASLMVYSPNADQLASTAVAAGAKIEMPLEDTFWGDRYGTLVDPFGHHWAVSTHIEELTPAQIQERTALVFPAKPPKKGAKVKPPKPGKEPWRKIAGTPATSPIPAGYHTVTPAITVAKAAEAIEFYKAAFGAVENDERMLMPDGRIMHAELVFGDSKLMISDAFAEYGAKSATDLGGSPVAFHFYTPDVDAVFAKVTGGGAKTLMPVKEQFWGDKYGAALDAFGFTWGVATHVEDVEPAEMDARMKKEMAQQKPTT